MRTGIKAARKFIESKSWKGYFNGYTEELANAKTDAQLTDFIRKNGGA
jgi:NADPH-dependent 7-cyano-7-deazaguanine reductase QueF-like protein